MESVFSLCDNGNRFLVEGPAVDVCLSFTFASLFNCLRPRERYKDKSFHELVARIFQFASQIDFYFTK